MSLAWLSTKWRLILPGLALAALAVAIAIFGGAFATRVYLDQAASRVQTTLRLAVAVLDGHMKRFEPLPALIADDDDIRELLADPTNPGLRQRANRYLKAINAQLKSSDIYVMTPDGDTIAASNYDQPVSFVGENFTYRPYFQHAMEGRPGRFFALGTTSLKRGYYFSAPVKVGTGVLGVVVFKIDIEPIETSWKGGEYEIIVYDPEGTIFMSGRSEWRYGSLQPLTADRLARTAASRRYANATLRELPVTQGRFQDRHRFLNVTDNGTRTQYLVLSERMEEAGWTVSVLFDTSSAHAQALTSVTAALLLLGLATLGGFVLWQRRARLAERLELQRSAREELEHRVEERTADLALVNRRLETEVAERRATEKQLRKTQSDLVQAGKLAALGQMSAALSHEFNQPLSAVKNYADNAAVLIERGRLPEAHDNLTRISGLTDRMASLSRHLRNFARKPNQKLGSVLLDEVVADALEIADGRIKAADVRLDVDLGPSPLWVRAGSVRLQQVLVNLISNAVDAVAGLPERTIAIAVKRGSGKVILSVHDSGPGVPAAIVERIFDPFFTTKGVGKGLGLGLSISYNIVKDFGGTLEAANHPGGGAVFSLRLDAARAATREAAE